MVINFFDRVIITGDITNGRTKVLLTYGDTLFKSFLKKATVLTSSVDLRTLTNRLSKLLLPILQEERLRLATDHRNQTVLTIEFFKSRVNFKDKSFSSIHKKVEAALSHFIEKDIVINSYSEINGGKAFQVEFKNLTPTEKKVFGLIDINESYETKYLEVIED